MLQKRNESHIAGNYTAYGLKKFLRKAQVKYFRLNSTIVTNDPKFPPLNFEFLKGTRVKVWSKHDIGFTWEFEANTFPKLLLKLLEKRVITQHELKRLFA